MSDKPTDIEIMQKCHDLGGNVKLSYDLPGHRRPATFNFHTMEGAENFAAYMKENGYTAWTDAICEVQL